MMMMIEMEVLRQRRMPASNSCVYSRQSTLKRIKFSKRLKKLKNKKWTLIITDEHETDQIETMLNK